MRNCHVTLQKLPCGLHESQCPLEDKGFLSALEYYICSVPVGYKSLIRGGRLLADSNPDVDPVDIALLFPFDDTWVKPVAFFMTIGKIYMDRDFCEQLKSARHRWFKKLSPPGYPDKSKKK